jgi:hypothetical protein
MMQPVQIKDLAANPPFCRRHKSVEGSSVCKTAEMLFCVCLVRQELATSAGLELVIILLTGSCHRAGLK